MAVLVVGILLPVVLLPHQEELAARRQAAILITLAEPVEPRQLMVMNKPVAVVEA
jgi:hypothetical protein